MLSAIALATGLALTAIPAPRLVITPQVIEVEARHPWADVEVRNEGGEERVVTGNAFAWAQDASGTMYLAAAEDVSVFPGTVRIQPGETRRLRVSVIRPPSERERAYRIALDVAMPDLAEDVRLLLPVFVAPRVRTSSVTLRVWCSDDRLCRAVLDNQGTTRVDAVRVTIETDSSGSAEQVRAGPSWVLSGDRRVFEFAVASGTARVVARAAILASDGATSDLRATTSTGLAVESPRQARSGS